MPAAPDSGNKRRLARVMAAYTKGDLEPLMDAVTDDVIWDSNALTSQFRFGGSFRGPLGVKEALSLIATEFHILRYDIQEMTGDGDIVWVLSDVEIRDRKTGKQIAIKLANRWQFRDGMIVSCTEFFDTAGTLIKLGRSVAA
jgi:ketosteroid isomerase-like protein